MSLLRRRRDPYQYYVHSSSVLFDSEAPSFPPLLLDQLEEDVYCGATFALFSSPKSATPFFESVTDLIELQKTPPSLSSSYLRILRHRSGVHSNLLTLDDRVSALESKFDRLAVNAKSRIGGDSRKYTWTTDLQGEEAGPGRKCKFTAVQGHHNNKAKGTGKKKKKKLLNYKWTAEMKEKGEEGPIKRTYTWQASTGGRDPVDGSKSEKKHKKTLTRIVEIEEPTEHGAVVLRHAFAKRAAGAGAAKGKKNPQDAALLIQMSFKAYLVRRSRVLRALRELAVSKSKLKEIRALFHNYLSYRRSSSSSSRILHDAEERQRFSENIIVLLLTVDAIEGPDVMVRASRKSMVDELEAMLDVVDPQPPGKSLSMKRRRTTFEDTASEEEEEEEA